MEGPIFSNMILADEINRTPPKTQAALLEAMQEEMRLPIDTFSDPLFTTQIPICGRYTLTEAQQDLLCLRFSWTTSFEEFEVARQTTGNQQRGRTVLTAEEIVSLQQVVQSP